MHVHEILRVRETPQSGVLLIDATIEIEGAAEAVTYALYPDDMEGAAPLLRAALAGGSYVIEPSTPQTAEEGRAAIEPLSSRQIRLTLLNIGITEDMVDEKLAGDALGIIEWKHATQFERLHPLIEALAAAFALPPEQVDDLWSWALQL